MEKELIENIYIPTRLIHVNEAFFRAQKKHEEESCRHFFRYAHDKIEEESARGNWGTAFVMPDWSFGHIEEVCEVLLSSGYFVHRFTLEKREEDERTSNDRVVRYEVIAISWDESLTKVDVDELKKCIYNEIKDYYDEFYDVKDFINHARAFRRRFTIKDSVSSLEVYSIALLIRDLWNEGMAQSYEEQEVY